MTRLFLLLLTLLISMGGSAMEGYNDFGRWGIAAKATPVWPKTASEMSDFLKVEGRAIPDTPTTPGRNKTVWEMGPSKITLEQHPYHPTAPD